MHHAEELRPTADARGLSNAHYVSQAVWSAERDALLFSTWAGIGVAAALPAPGDAVPVSFLGIPLVAVRGRDGAVRVFQNVCRHRGMILVDRPGTVGRVIRCPYHSWSYALSGELVATPHVGGPGRNLDPAIRREELGLVEVRSHVWRDVIFVNIDGTAPPFEVHAADAIARWAEFDRPLHHGGEGSRFTLEVACNWKLAVENYCESYHLPWVHPGLNAYSRLEDHYHIEAPGRFSGQGTRVYRPQPSKDGRRFADFAGLAAHWDSAAEYIALYPNVLFGVHRDHAYSIVLEPVAPDRTREHVDIYYAATLDPDQAAMAERNTRLWHDIFVEDIGVVEGMQRGRSAPGFDGGRFSPAMDGPTRCFHEWVAGRMTGAARLRAAE